MEYLLLIYEDEKRFSQGFDPAELVEYRAFGQKFAHAVKGGKALQPTNAARRRCECATANRSPRMGLSPRPRSSSAASIWLRRPAATRPSRWRRTFRERASAPSRCGPL
jgi:hypothetical protein